MAHYDEFHEVGLGLERWHGLFYQFWSLGEPRFTKKIPTAAVGWNRKGQFVEFLFNPDFWDSLDYTAREFVICHECIHVLYEHGPRMKGLKNKREQKIGNLAADVVVNHALCDKFDFDRAELDCPMTVPVMDPNTGKQAVDPYSNEPITEEKPLEEILIWKDSIFPNPDDIEDGREFEYYYAKIKELADQMPPMPGGEGDGQPQKGQGKGKPQPGQGGGSSDDDDSDPFPDQDTIDSHDFVNKPDADEEEDGDGDGQGEGDDEEDDAGADDLEEIPEAVLDDLVEEIREHLSQDENKSMTGRGIQRGSQLHKVKLQALKAKQGWEKVVEMWTAQGERPNDLWTRRVRRHFFLDDSFVLPAEEDDEKKGGKVNVWFFQDTSYSCKDQADYFFNAALTFPEHFFKIRMFGFSTEVYEIDKRKQVLKGFDGTHFDIIEKWIQAKMKAEGCAYPDAVFIFSDGDGNRVDPAFPDRWYWFLGGRDYTERCIPKGSKLFQLKDFA